MQVAEHMYFLDIFIDLWSLSGFDSEKELGEWTWTHAVEEIKKFCLDPVLHDDNFFKGYEIRRSARSRVRKMYYTPPKAATRQLERVQEEQRKPSLPRKQIYVHLSLIVLLLFFSQETLSVQYRCLTQEPISKEGHVRLGNSLN